MSNRPPDPTSTSELVTAQDVLLEPVNGLSLSIGSGGTVTLSAAGKQLVSGPHALTVVERFCVPATAAAALDDLAARARSVQQWSDLVATLTTLIDAGMLVPKGTAAAPASASSDDLFPPRVHVSMLNDRPRTSAFLTAIEQVIRPGDVVLEIGTGTGVLAMAAARAGARHVYAIEASAMSTVARDVIAANGLSDRITVLHGWSSRLDLPERADVLVAELIGSEPLAEGVLEITQDAIRRLLQPDARLLPRSIQITATPVSLPDRVLGYESATEANLARWRDWYGFDFARFSDASNAWPHRIRARASDLSMMTLLSPSATLRSINLADADASDLEATARVTTTRGGLVHGVAIGFNLQLSDSLVLDHLPESPRPDDSWGYDIWMLAEPIAVRNGATLALQVIRDQTHFRVTCRPLENPGPAS